MTTPLQGVSSGDALAGARFAAQPISTADNFNGRQRGRHHDRVPRDYRDPTSGGRPDLRFAGTTSSTTGTDGTATPARSTLIPGADQPEGDNHWPGASSPATADACAGFSIAPTATSPSNDPGPAPFVRPDRVPPGTRQPRLVLPDPANTGPDRLRSCSTPASSPGRPVRPAVPGPSPRPTTRPSNVRASGHRFPHATRDRPQHPRRRPWTTTCPGPLLRDPVSSLVRTRTAQRWPPVLRRLAYAIQGGLIGGSPRRGGGGGVGGGSGSGRDRLPQRGLSVLTPADLHRETPGCPIPGLLAGAPDQLPAPAGPARLPAIPRSPGSWPARRSTTTRTESEPTRPRPAPSPTSPPSATARTSTPR